MFALVSRGFLNPAQSKLNSFVWSRGSFRSAEFTSNDFFKLLILTLLIQGPSAVICVWNVLGLLIQYRRRASARMGAAIWFPKKEAFDFFASTEGGAYSETPTKCEHIYIRMPTSILDPVSAGNMTARKRHFNFFRSSCSRGRRHFA